ncbi:MAG: hypothetical protein R8L07_04420 [Alphaproteobacteria bacterium]|nr:hypothetical protein [Alphaproteobacteria bacterium]
MAEKSKTKQTTAKTKQKNKRTAAKAERAQNAQSVQAAEPVDAQSAAAASADFMRENVIPLSLVAAGVGMLAVKNVNGGDNAVMNAAGRGKEGVSAAAASVTKHGRTISGKARNGVQRVGSGARRSVDGTRQMVATHPVASGIAAAALGAGLAIALPKLLNRSNSGKA